MAMRFKMLTIAAVWLTAWFFNPALAQPPGAISLDSATLDARFGPYKLDMRALAEDFKKLVNADLIVTDSSQTRWNVLEYRIGWRKKDTTIDIKTGVRKPMLGFTAERIEGGKAKLPPGWQEAFKNSAQSGETIYFEDILARHPKTGRIRRARNITITIL